MYVYDFVAIKLFDFDFDFELKPKLHMSLFTKEVNESFAKSHSSME